MRPSLLWLLCLLVPTACSSSVLIRREDSSFQNAQQRLARTAEAVETTKAPAGERLLFLQAEALYRYRFEPPPRTAGSYVAQAAAVTFDFPALQALAGSLDLIDLRLKTYDGAVHLWETLLTHAPRTVLRPLALYRLGWAYRSSGATGFPRQSGDDAFDALIAESPTSPLASLAREARAVVVWKSKDAATGYSILPGLGQMYVSEHLSGAIRMAVAVAAVALIAVPAYIGYRRREDLAWHRDWPLLATGLGGVVLLSIDYTTAYQDALRGVIEWNERAEAEFEQRNPESP